MLPRALLERIADGREHSRSQLGESLALGSAELGEQLDSLESTGLEIVATGSDTIRLRDPIDWLEPRFVESELTASRLGRIESLEVAFEIESTNRRLLDSAPPAPAMARIAMAEYQTAGRGRRGRCWTMPPGSGVALSAAWRFGAEHRGLAALSLAAGTVARRAVRELTALDVGLKWPNDLLVEGAKLGGILVELSQLSGGECHVVVGIGINVKVPPSFLQRASDFPHGACDLAGVAPEWPVDRAALAARLIDRLIDLFLDFPKSGFEPYRDEWLAGHVLDGESVELSMDSGTAFATVVDVGVDGALIVQHENGERQSVISGDVTIRVQR